MADGIYVGMSAMVARSEQLDAIADNLANANTPGFKAARPAFETFLPNEPSDKAFIGAVHTGIDLTPGITERTGNPMDVTPEDGAFLAVKTPGGNAAYTRAGHLSLDSADRLVSGENLVLGVTGHPISVPHNAHVHISETGVVTANGQPIDELARYKMEGGVQRISPTLLTPTQDGKAVAHDGNVRVGELERGNASPLELTVQMVNAQRSYEMSTQAIQTYRRLDDRITDLGKLR